MKWLDHSNLGGKHAFLSPSSYHWLRYDTKKLERAYVNNLKKEEGTALHAFASMAINKRIKLANHKKAINMFVNDAIGFDMASEQTLYYSDNCFGTADAILYDEDTHTLRVHDLKTGLHIASMEQLHIYCALFCLEYHMNPEDIEFICCIYQGSEIREDNPEPNYIRTIMEQIVKCDDVLTKLKLTM